MCASAVMQADMTRAPVAEKMMPLCWRLLQAKYKQFPGLSARFTPNSDLARVLLDAKSALAMQPVHEPV